MSLIGGIRTILGGKQISDDLDEFAKGDKLSKRFYMINPKSNKIEILDLIADSWAIQILKRRISGIEKTYKTNGSHTYLIVSFNNPGNVRIVDLADHLIKKEC